LQKGGKNAWLNAMLMVNPFVELISYVIMLYSYVVWAWLILSWLISFNVVNRHQPAVQKINFALFKLTDPLLRRIRKFMPDLGNIDISPIILILLLNFLDHLLVYYSLRW
jgi:YggT family protein